MNKRKNTGKIPLGMLKGKPITTSVPSIAIRFDATAEQLEELYTSDDDHFNTEKNLPTTSASTTVTSSETESSPLRSYLPKLVKRSTSIDASPLTTLDSSPPSDPWKYFSNFTGKLTKRFEEIKSRNLEEESPKHNNKSVKDSKENSSLSDSEDLSESSISKTCGIVSTTEGVEMSSDDETPSLEKDKKIDEDILCKKPCSEKCSKNCSSSNLRQRFRLIKNKLPQKEGSLNYCALAKLYSLNTGIESAIVDENTEEVESGIDALEDSNLQCNIENDKPGVSGKDSTSSLPHLVSSENLAKVVSEVVDNIEIDEESILNIKEVSGADIRASYFSGNETKTVFAPSGFVDVRQTIVQPKQKYLPLIITICSFAFYFWIQTYSVYMAGIMAGIAVTWLFNIVYTRIFPTVPVTITETNYTQNNCNTKQIYEIPAIKEYQPVTKFEGWVNEYPDLYDPHTYHISQTQSVYLKLQGNLLRISHTRSKVPKRAMWNEANIKPVFTHHRIYNLLGAKVYLLPEGLAKKRHWSKKYPICVTLNKDQVNFEYVPSIKSDSGEDLGKKEKDETSSVKEGKKTTFSLSKKKSSLELQPQRFSKLTEEEEEYDFESEPSRPSSPSPPEISQETSDEQVSAENVLSAEAEMVEMLDESLERFDDQIYDDNSFNEDEWTTFTPEDSPTETCLYLFGRTDREKEDWFRRLVSATHRGAHIPSDETISTENELKEMVSDTLIDAAVTEAEYLKYMAKFQKFFKLPKKSDKSSEKNESDTIIETAKEISCDVLWINSLIGRILFDCMHDPNFTLRVKDRIQRKLSAIKLPYFIEELIVTELSLGNTPPLVHQASKPVIDQRGLWVDLEMTYDGLVVLIMQTKLNLMKLKQPPPDKNTEARSAMFHSDVDDSAESSTDDDTPQLPTNNNNPLDSSGFPVAGLGGTSNTSKKFIKMVDRIAESKFFQAATENRYIKKAMEGVSNTDLGLKVEIKSLSGTLALNVPPPPTDRIWIGFRPVPKLLLSAQPIVGERNITFMHITSWIEKKLLQEFQKLLVIPNMEDLTIPVMCPKLPE